MTVCDPVIVSQSFRPPKAVFEVSVPRELYYLRGHFPEAPILPGVVQVHWAILLARGCLSLKPTFLGIEALKFHHVIKPETSLSVALEYSEANGKLHFSYSSELGRHSQGRVLFG